MRHAIAVKIGGGRCYIMRFSLIIYNSVLYNHIIINNYYNILLFHSDCIYLYEFNMLYFWIIYMYNSYSSPKCGLMDLWIMTFSKMFFQCVFHDIILKMKPQQLVHIFNSFSFICSVSHCEVYSLHSCAFNLKIFLSREITVWICLVIKLLSEINLISSYLACQLLQIVQLHLKTQLAMNRNNAQDN